MREETKKYEVMKENFRAYDMGTEADKNTERHNSDKIKLKDDGNVTRQIYDAIGFDTLQSYYNVYQENESEQ